MRSTSLLLSTLLLLAPSTVVGQRRIVHDTLGPDTPTALTCGFCAGEKFGVVFRELPAPRAGLSAADFPIVLDTLEVGLAAAGVSSGACVPSATGGTIDALVEIWSGGSVPTGDISGLPADSAWSAGETLVWSRDAVPLTLSVADTGGRYTLMVNAVQVRDDVDLPIEIASGAYVRVVVTLPPGTPGSSSLCEPSFESPGGFPVRDDDGQVAPERNFIYALGAGWFWNESFPGGEIGGDWAIRLQVFANGPGVTDGGEPSDAGMATDAGAIIDGGAGLDGGTAPEDEGGCGCRAVGEAHGSSVPLLLSLVGLGLVVRRRPTR
jgi:MYXO-CTERM domain-containing protein